MAAPSPCRCGHQRDVHEHYRRGSDCAVCGVDGCARFRAAHGPAAAGPVAAAAARGVLRALRRLTQRGR